MCVQNQQPRQLLMPEQQQVRQVPVLVSVPRQLLELGPAQPHRRKGER